MEDVLYVPDIESNLLSVKKLTEKEYCIQFDKEICKIIKNNNVVAVANLVSVFYSISVRTANANVVQDDKRKGYFHEWHRKLGLDPSFETLNKKKNNETKTHNETSLYQLVNL